MQTGAITGYIDVAQLALYAFWLFFAGLIYYLHRENKREGYPLVADDRAGISPVVVQGFPPIPDQKAFTMPDGSKLMVPRAERREPLSRFQRVSKAQGSPIVPTGEPLTAGIGPGAWAQRHNGPDLTFDDGQPKIVPLRVAPAFFLATEDPDIIGYTVIGVDNEVAGTVVEAWIDRSEVVVRYLEVQLASDASHRVLLPMTFIRINRKTKQIICRYIKASQFALAPVPAKPDQVTLREEDQIQAFYAAGQLYAWPGREGPLL
ncbi:MAG: photosynthetic reaction center subunit H [Acetobacteraceae bacterium]|nr:photosynthetic reaction center subunit H [Acetobacteraceae bacterium]